MLELDSLAFFLSIIRPIRPDNTIYEMYISMEFEKKQQVVKRSYITLKVASPMLAYFEYMKK
jgi:hypothetical protein